MNISLILQMAADAAPDRIGLVCEGRQWSYGALDRMARGAARSIEESGCAHVSLLDESSEAAAIALFGAAMAGLPYVPLNYRLADTDLAALLGRIAPAFVIGDGDRVERLSPATGHMTSSRASFLEASRISAATECEGPEPVEEIAVQIFTSGTTAAPKAAL